MVSPLASFCLKSHTLDLTAVTYVCIQTIGISTISQSLSSEIKEYLKLHFDCLLHSLEIPKISSDAALLVPFGCAFFKSQFLTTRNCYHQISPS